MAKRRAKGEGGIYRRKVSRWAGQYVVETATGTKRRYVYAKTHKEVAEKLRKAMGERDAEMAFDAGSLTLSDYLDRWLNDSVRSSVRRRAFDRYEETSRLHIVPAFGRVKLKALNPVHVQGLYRKKLDEGLFTRSVQYVHAEFVILRLLGAEGWRGVWVNSVHRGPFPTRWTPSPIRISPKRPAGPDVRPQRQAERCLRHPCLVGRERRLRRGKARRQGCATPLPAGVDRGGVARGLGTREHKPKIETMQKLHVELNTVVIQER
jgi:Phage integrase, N-terminal SAM-like domain